MRRAVTIALLAALALYVGWRFAWPYIDTRPEQDACEFGSVSNARYRELLAEARRRSKSVWPALKGDQLDQSDNLRSRIADLTAGVDSLPERIAAMHAVMREAGAFFMKSASLPQYKKLEIIPNNPDLPLSSTELFFPYLVDSLLLGTVDPVDRYAKIDVVLPLVVFNQRLTVINGLKRPARFDEFHAIVLYPCFFCRMAGLGVWINPHATDLTSKQSSCPPVPSEDWLDVYRLWKTMQGGESRP